MRSISHLIHLASLVGAILPETHHEHRLKKRASSLLPLDSFAGDSMLFSYFEVGYPWGDHMHHNGAATMLKSQVSAANGYLSLKSDYIGGGQYSYNSGTVYAKQPLTVPVGGGIDIQARYQASTQPGCWPALWLTAVEGWPPEIDCCEWKGNGKVSFNTFNTSSQVASLDVPYSSPESWHTIRNELRAEADGTTLAINFYLDGSPVATQYGVNMVNVPFWLIIDYQMLGSSGGSGPQQTTYFNVQGLSVTAYG